MDGVIEKAVRAGVGAGAVTGAIAAPFALIIGVGWKFMEAKDPLLNAFLIFCLAPSLIVTILETLLKAFALTQEIAEAPVKAARAKQQEQEALLAEERRLQTSLANLTSLAQSLADRLPDLSQAAERAVDKAEEEYAEGVFAPFWDAVETAATKLATFDFVVRDILKSTVDYRLTVAKLTGAAPPFGLSMKALPDVTHASNRLSAIVRQAQKNPNFSTIYELRKTNRVLVEGFSNLGQALSEVGDRIDSSMTSLRMSIEDGFAEVISSSRQASTDLVGEAKQSREQAASDAEKQREYEREAKQMLDNIQRRKLPLDRKARDGEY